MKHFSLVALAFCLLSCISTYNKPNSEIVGNFDVQPDQILIVVKVTKTDYTDYYPASQCVSDTCIPWSFWYIHKAEVIDVIKGDYNEPQVSFSNLQHADYVDEIKSEWYVQLQAIPSKELQEQLKVNYYVVRHDSEFQQSTKSFD